MLSEDEVRNLSPQDRQQLIRMLTRQAEPGQADGRASSALRRTFALALIVACCVALAIWIGVLAVTLPRYYRSGDWRGAWVGFDLALLAVFAVTGWAAWRRRQLLVICLIVLATLLCCDAWFDVVLDARTSGFWLSLASALVIELPLATLAVLAARRLLRLSLSRIRLLEGMPREVPSLRKTPLLGAGSAERLIDLFPMPPGEQSPPWRTSAQVRPPSGTAAQPGSGPPSPQAAEPGPPGRRGRAG